MEMVGKYIEIIQGRLLPAPLFTAILPLGVILTHNINDWRQISYEYKPYFKTFRKYYYSSNESCFGF
jgi:hypothetical protein